MVGRVMEIGLQEPQQSGNVELKSLILRPCSKP